MFAALFLLVLFASSCQGSAESDLADLPDLSLQTDEETFDDADLAETDEPAGDGQPDSDVTTEPELDTAVDGESSVQADTDDVESTTDVDLLDRSLATAMGTGLELSGDEQACAIARLQSEPTIMAAFERSSSADDLDLTPQELTTVTIAAIDCAPDTVATSLSQGISLDSSAALSTESGDCFAEAIIADTPDRAELISGFIALGNEAPVDIASRKPVVNTFAACVPASLFLDNFAAELVEDPTVAAGLDLPCLESGVNEATLRPMWEAWVTNPKQDVSELDGPAMEPLITVVFDCISFGQVIAAEAASGGVELSAGTIACIDSDVSTIAVADIMSADPVIQAAIGQVVVACLTPEELAAISPG